MTQSTTGAAGQVSPGSYTGPALQGQGGGGFDPFGLAALLAGINMFNQFGASGAQRAANVSAFNQFQENQRAGLQQLQAILNNPNLQQLQATAQAFQDPRQFSPQRAAERRRITQGRETSQARLEEGLAQRGITESGAAERMRVGLEDAFNRSIQDLFARFAQMGVGMQQQVAATQIPIQQAIAQMTSQQPIFTEQAQGPFERLFEQVGSGISGLFG